MAFVNNSGDKQMADNELNDFSISDDYLFFDNDDKNEITHLSDKVKKQLNISISYTYPYDNLDFMMNAGNFTDSLDNDNNVAGAATIIVESESKSEQEPDPYWKSIKVEQLKGLVNTVEELFSDSDESIPSLKMVSSSENSEMGILTPPNSDQTDDKDERNSVLSNNDKELVLPENKGEDGLTSYDAAMLVNVGNAKGVQTELYDSGASQHMSPYCNHFEDYVSIAPKPIMATDKWYFQAIGRGNLQIKIPNNSNSTTVLLKDICIPLSWYGTNVGINWEIYCSQV